MGMAWERGYQWEWPGNEATSGNGLGTRLPVGMAWERGYYCTMLQCVCMYAGTQNQFDKAYYMHSAIAYL